ncbi:cell wall-binding repeat-containing protein [Bifidobacterium asteroides]|nr:cell wall-binding repeat-containing protein [Bifidobacterium asteroides]MCP8614799.1 cell wall-binding repeat-containing protein [Bifidobacterium asteroides]
MSQVKKSLPLKLGASLIGGATLIVCVGALTLPARAADSNCTDDNKISECVPDQNLARAIAAGVQGVSAASANLNQTVGEAKVKDNVAVDAHGLNISDLRGLGTFERIVNLDLSHNKIHDVSELSKLPDLVNLDLSYNYINSDLSELGAKNKLETLAIESDGNYRLRSISAIGSFTRLTQLNLTDQNISDVTPLKGLDLLKSLTLTKNKIVDVSPLGSLNSLETLKLDNNRIKDILPITGLPKLSASGLSADDQTIIVTPRHEYNKDADWVLDGIKVNYYGTRYADFDSYWATPSGGAPQVRKAGDNSKISWLAPAKYRSVGYSFGGQVSTNNNVTVGHFGGTVTQYASVVKRLSGNVRYDTMGAIVEEAYNGSANTVIVASGSNFPDALAASGLSGKLDAPIVLTDSNQLSARADGQLARLRPNRVIVVGGPDAVSDGVVDQIARRVTAPSEADVVRISGATRRDTANEIFAQAKKQHAKGEPDKDWNATTAIIATGDDFADALSISSLAKHDSFPVFLSGKDGLDASTVKTIKDQGFANVIIAGGSQAVPQSVVSQLKTAGVDGPNIHRLGGATRYQTSLQIAQYQRQSDNDASLKSPVFATGQNFPDALVGGVLAGKNANPILLVSSDTSVNTDALNWIKSASKTGTNGFDPDTDFAYVLGGLDAVSAEVSEQISSVLGD